MSPDPAPTPEWTLTDSAGRPLVTVIDERAIAADLLAAELLNQRRPAEPEEVTHVYAALGRLRDRGWALIRIERTDS